MIKVTLYVDDSMIPESFMGLAHENLWSVLRGALLHQMECKMRAICREIEGQSEEDKQAYLAHCDHEIALIEDVLSTMHLEVADEANDERDREGRRKLVRSAERREEDDKRKTAREAEWDARDAAKKAQEQAQ